MDKKDRVKIEIPKDYAERINLIVEKDTRYQSPEQFVIEAIGEKFSIEELSIEKALYKILEERRAKERERVIELALKIIDGEITVDHPEGFVTTEDVLEIMGKENISRQSVASYLKNNYRESNLVRRNYGRNLSERRFAYARDLEKIPPYPYEEIRVTKRKDESKLPKRIEKIPERIEKMLERAKANKKPKEISIFKSPKYKRKLGESLDNWLIRIHDEPRTFNKIVDLANECFDEKPNRSNLSSCLRKLVDQNKFGFKNGETYKKN